MQDPSIETPGIDTELTPRYWVPLAVVALGIVTLPLQRLWGPAAVVGLVVCLFGLFLLLQSLLLRLRFEVDELVVKRRDVVLRRFPYAQWLGWRLFWPPLPVLFYFREQKSIHLLPVLFDARALRLELKARLPQLSAPD